jgi:hypothetical protein
MRRYSLRIPAVCVWIFAFALATPLMGQKNNSQTPPQLSKDEVEKRKLDKAIVEVVFRDLLKNEDVGNDVATGAKRDQIRLMPQGGTLTWEIAENIFKVYLQKGQSVPQEIQKDIQQRNKELIDMSYLATNSKIIRLVDLKTRKQRIPRSRRSEENGEIYLWLPGYSADNRQAVVRLNIWESMHGGALVTYMLVQEGTAWKVKWLSIYHFS